MMQMYTAPLRLEYYESYYFIYGTPEIVWIKLTTPENASRGCSNASKCINTHCKKY